MKSEKLKIIRNALGRSYKSGSEYLFHCPFCSHDKLKLSVNIDKNYWKCWICDKSGRNIGFLVRRFGSPDDKLAWSKYENRVETSDFDSLFAEKEEEIAPKVDLPKSFCSLTSKKRDTAALNARQYLRERGIGKPDILKWKIGYASAGEYEGRVIIPSFAPDGFVSYFIARSYVEHGPSIRTPLQAVISSLMTFMWIGRKMLFSWKEFLMPLRQEMLFLFSDQPFEKTQSSSKRSSR